MGFERQEDSERAGSARERTAEELAREAQAGSSAAFERIVQRFHRPLFRFLALRSGSAEDAEDLTQESFVRAWQQIGRYDPRRRFSTWLFTLARRLAASRTRATAGRGDRGRGGVEPGADVASEVDAAAVLAAREERENLWRVALELVGREATSALWLRYAEDLPAAEIARVLGRREVTVRVILFRARTALGRHLERGEAPAASRVASAPVLPARGYSGGR